MAAFGRPFALGLSAIGSLPDFSAGNPDRVDVHASNQAMIGVQLGEILRRAGGELSIAPKHDARIVLGEPAVAVKMKSSCSEDRGRSCDRRGT